MVVSPDAVSRGNRCIAATAAQALMSDQQKMSMDNLALRESAFLAETTDSL
jgi:hypothetical protein